MNRKQNMQGKVKMAAFKRVICLALALMLAASMFAGQGTEASAAQKTNVSHHQKYSGYKVYKAMDVSYFQGDINWTKAKNAGITHVFIRISYTESATNKLVADPKAKEYIAGALAAGMKVGVYVNSQARTVKEAKKEARFGLKLLKSYGYDSNSITLPFVNDCEGKRVDSGVSNAQLAKNVRAFCKVVSKAGYEPMVYNSKSKLESWGFVNDTTYKIWMAHYLITMDTTDYSGEYWVWQYTSEGDGSKYGVSSKYVDLDYIYVGGKGSTNKGSYTSSSANSSETEIDTSERLSTPELKSVTNVSSGVKIKWKKVEGATGYRVYRKTKGGTWKVIAENVTSNKYVDKTAKTGTKYWYTVRAYRGKYAKAKKHKNSKKFWSSYDKTGLKIKRKK